MSTERDFCRVRVLGLAILLAASSLGLMAGAPPAAINYQGVLRDGGGQPVADGAYDMAFLFYDAPSGGTLLLTDSHLASGSGAVPTGGGLFAVTLGSGTLTPGSETTLEGVFANHTSVYMALKVGTDAEMTPRAHVVSAPFAQSAHVLDGLGSAAFAPSSHAHDASAITSGSLPTERGGTAVSGSGTSGNVLTSNGSAWTSSAPPSAASLGAVVDTYNTTLLRFGSGTAGDPFKLALKTSNSNTWTAQQTFNAETDFGGYNTKFDTSGNMVFGQGLASLTHPLTIYQSTARSLFETTGNAQGSLLTFRNSTSTATSFGAIDFEDNASAVRGRISTLVDGSLSFSTYSSGTLSEKMRIGATGSIGIGAPPDLNAGLHVASSSTSCKAYLGYSEKGIEAYGNTAGGYFKQYNYANEAYAGYPGYGIQANGSSSGGDFQHATTISWAQPGDYNYGIDAFGYTSGGGAHLKGGTGAWTFLPGSTGKLVGSGDMSFVQNHPQRKDRVIVYAAPEGDEVATYTRGSARLVSGVARVKLGETFQWVTNPDIGLTAHLMPKGDCNGLYVESVSTTELVVRELQAGKSDAAFDYVVYGLRIGFEEYSILQEKKWESYIPSFRDHRERYARYPDLRAYNALERFLGMESSVRGESAGTDFSRARALRDAIHEYDPATDPPVAKLFGFGESSGAGQTTQASSSPPARKAVAAPESGAASRAGASGGGNAAVLETGLPCFPASVPAEQGDVLVADTEQAGSVRPCAAAADLMVVGIAAGPAAGCAADGLSVEETRAAARVPMATSGVALCKADTAYGPIHRGDLLVTSPTPGHAMRAPAGQQDAIVGKALEPLESGAGAIRVLVLLR